MSFIKKAARYLHRYLGWASGLVVLIICATGAILLVQPEVERALEPGKYTIPRHDGAPLDWDEFIARLEASESASFAEPTTVTVARIIQERGARRATYLLLNARDAHDSWTYQCYADPYVGEGVAYGASRALEFFRTVRQLHTRLCLPAKIGRPITGYSCLVFMLVLLTGLIRWLPRRLNNKSLWRNALTLTLTKGGSRALFDLHNVLGFYSALILLGLAFTGAWLGLGWFRDGFNRSIGLETAPRPIRQFDCPAWQGEPATLQAIMDAQAQQTPEACAYDIRFGKSAHAPLVITPRPGFAGFCYQTSYYWDRGSAALLGVDSYKALSGPYKIASIMLPFHKGQIFSDFSRYLFLLICLIACMLATTGYWLSFNRWRRTEQSAKATGGKPKSDKNNDVPTTDVNR